MTSLTISIFSSWCQPKRKTSKRPKARIFSDKNIQKIVDELSTVNWNQVLNHNNGNQDCSEFYNILKRSTVNHFHLCKYQENGTRTSLGLLKYLYPYGIKIDYIRRVFSIQMIPIFIDTICIKNLMWLLKKGRRSLLPEHSEWQKKISQKLVEALWSNFE